MSSGFVSSTFDTGFAIVLNELSISGPIEFVGNEFGSLVLSWVSCGRVIVFVLEDAKSKVG